MSIAAIDNAVRSTFVENSHGFARFLPWRSGGRAVYFPPRPRGPGASPLASKRVVPADCAGRMTDAGGVARPMDGDTTRTPLRLSRSPDPVGVRARPIRSGVFTRLP